MKSIGGYLELELSKGNEYHKEAIRLNTGRNALEYILRANRYKKIYLPYYSCDVLLQPISKLGLAYEFYNINEKFEPHLNYHIQSEEALLYINYFGLKDNCTKILSKSFDNLIIDNSQSFYSKPIIGVDSFYSPRKFFGVTDGAYLYSKEKIRLINKEDASSDRFKHLLTRIDKCPEYGYPYFMENEKRLAGLPVKRMSRLTQRILKSINYNIVAQKRLRNYNHLKNALSEHNNIQLKSDANQIPMVYPFLSHIDNLREQLIREKIYTPQYWENVLAWTSRETIENNYCRKMVFLPIDQRYDLKDMNVILRIVNRLLKR